MLLSAAYYSYNGILDSEMSCTLHATFPLELQGKRLTCRGFLPFWPKNMPVVLTGDLLGDDFTVSEYAHETDSGVLSEFLIRTKACTNREAAILFHLWSGTTVWNLEESDKKTLCSAGITADSADKLIELFRSVRKEEELNRKLREYGYSPDAIDTFHRHKRSLDDLYRSPYAIGYECGVSLTICDRIAAIANEMHFNSTSFHRHSKVRLQTILRMTLDTIVSMGHTYVTAPVFAKLLERKSRSAYWDAPDKDVLTLYSLTSPAITLKTLENETIIYVTKCLKQEEETEVLLKNLLGQRVRGFSVSQKAIARYDPGQQAAISGCLSGSPVHILTGGPGTGKTTTTNAIVKQLEKNGEKVMLCAPTGRAAVRMKESTRHGASTIHRMLGIYGIYDSFSATFNQDNPLVCDAVIVDEVSMLGLDLFLQLLRAIPEGCRLILVGDEQQLPSISPGSVLHDLIESGRCTVYRLTEIHRQANGSSIVDNAYNVLNQSALISDADFEILNYTNRQDAMNALLSIFTAKYNPADPYHLQILCPTKVGKLGSFAVNEAILGLNTQRVPVRGKYAVGDKVMTIVNNYELMFQYMNGDIGTIKSIYEDMITIEQPGGKDLYVKDLRDIQHAYASTIHKSQGSEYDEVVLVLDTENRSMLYRNLLYTAITRAKKHVTVITIGNALDSAIHKDSPKRFSGLCARIQDKVLTD